MGAAVVFLAFSSANSIRKTIRQTRQTHAIALLAVAYAREGTTQWLWREGLFEVQGVCAAARQKTISLKVYVPAGLVEANRAGVTLSIRQDATTLVERKLTHDGSEDITFDTSPGAPNEFHFELNGKPAIAPGDNRSLYLVLLEGRVQCSGR